MEYKTHIAGGAVAGAVAMTASALKTIAVIDPPIYFYPLMMGAAILGGLTPDIDLRKSKAGQKTGPASTVIQTLWGHRTLFHAPLLYFGLYYLLKPSLGITQSILFAFLAGAISHIFLDMMNAKGIPLLYPFGGHFHIAKVKNGSIIEKNIRIALTVLAILLTIRLLILRAFNF